MLCPPATKTLPSGRIPCPAQKRSPPLNDVVAKPFVFGSHIVPAVLLLLASWPQARTLPVGIRVTWIGRIGQLVTELHCPTTEGSGGGGGGPTARSAIACITQAP